MMDLAGKTIAISRTDSIGDVALTLPLCVYLKNKYPTCRIVFVGDTYTRPLISCLREVDEIIAWSVVKQLPKTKQIKLLKDLHIDYFVHVFPRKEMARLAKKAGIPNRIGTSHRFFHFLTCNIRPSFTRKHSSLHEAQLNFELLRPLGLKEIPSFDQLVEWTKIKAVADLKPELLVLLNTQRKKIILHPKSKGSAVEWGVTNFMQLAELLAEKGHHVYFSGTEAEGQLFRKEIPQHTCITDISGTMSLDEFIAFIAECDGLVAASTGPLHIAGLLQKQAIGLFSPRKPIHPGRWKPLGVNSQTLVFDESCADCAAGKTCNCISSISPEKVASLF